MKKAKKPKQPEECPKKAKVKERIRNMVRHAEDKFMLGVKFYIIARQVNAFLRGTEHTLLSIAEEMDADGEIFLYADSDSNRLVMAPEIREYLQYDEMGQETPETKNIIKAKWGK